MMRDLRDQHIRNLQQRLGKAERERDAAFALLREHGIEPPQVDELEGLPRWLVAGLRATSHRLG